MIIVAYVLGIVAVIFAIKKTGYSSKVISGILAFFWLWNGIVFQGIFFSQLNPTSGYVSAVLLFIEGIIFIVTGVFKQDLSFNFKPDTFGIVGWFCVLYGMVGYPVIEYVLGRGYPQLAAFGLITCPTTIFTLGMLLWADKRVPRYVLPILFLFVLMGVMPVSIGIIEDIGLVVLGLIASVMILFHGRRIERE